MSYQQAPRRGGGGGFNRNNKRRNQNRRNERGFEEEVGGNGEVDLRGGGDGVGVNGNNEKGSGSEGVFGSADEGVVDLVSSEEEVEEPESIVNASLIVNLSNANVSQVIEEDRRGVGLDLGVRDESSDTLVGGSPVEEENRVVGVEEEEVGKVSLQVQAPPDVVPERVELSSGTAPGSTLSNSSEESSTLADSEVEKLMSGGGGGGGVDVARLPGTVTVLKAPNGVVVYLVGTAHFSHQSQVDVINTIQMTNPTLVLLELCSSRRNILSLDEETVLKEVSEMSFQKVRIAMSNSGAVQGVLHLLLLSMSAQLTKKLGMAPGGEFRAAMREARNIPGCVLLLGDRPFNITISRALAALSVFQKVKLAWQFLTSNEDITKEEIERCKELDAISMLLKEMTGEFPSITEVFVNERDVFLAHSLYLAATSDAHGGGSGRDRVVVGVVGMGHVPGIARNWGKTTDENVNKLLKIPETPISSIIFFKSLKICWYGVLAYGVYRVGKRVCGGRSFDLVGKVERVFKGVVSG